MTRNLFFILFLVMVSPVTAQAGPALEISGTKIILEEPILEGTVAQGEFVVFNKGDEDLVIKSVAPG
jgi:P pilus assembly chaperone PapD